ncbi:hypothetical protein BH23GEM9_BH23GEM9_20610 [soil metagenome]
MHSRNLVVGILHLVLLGIVTPAFVLAARDAQHTQTPRPGRNTRHELSEESVGVSLHAPVRVLFYAAGLLLMVGSLVITAWPWAMSRILLLGVPANVLFLCIFIGGTVAAAALLTLLPIPPSPHPPISSHLQPSPVIPPSP